MISGNYGDGVLIFTDTGTAGNVVTGNYIGLDAAGLHAMANAGNGVTVAAAGVAVEDNVISGNAGYGIALGFTVYDSDTYDYVFRSGNRNQVIGNWIGTLANHNDPMGNRQDGIFVEGSDNLISGNTIADNWLNAGGSNVHGNGVTIDSGTGNRITANSIYGNGEIPPESEGKYTGPTGLGIDLGNDGPTLNHAGIRTTGPNLYQNAPAISGANWSGGTLVVSGTLTTGVPNATYTIEVFANRVLDAKAVLEGERYLGSITVETDADGVATFTGKSLPDADGFGSFVTATATDDVGNTSEFSDSASISLSGTEPYGPPTINVVGGEYVYDGQPHCGSGSALDGDGNVIGSLDFTYYLGDPLTGIHLTGIPRTWAFTRWWARSRGTTCTAPGEALPC